MDWSNREECLAAVKQDGCTLKYVEDQDLEICLAAVKEDGWALKYVKEQYKEECKAAKNILAVGNTVSAFGESRSMLVNQHRATLGELGIPLLQLWGVFKWLETADFKTRKRGV